MINKSCFGASVALVTLTAALTTSTASAFPSFGQGADGNCYLCHSTVVDFRMEMFDFSGFVDPNEDSGVPDEGSLPFYTVQAGGNVSLNVRTLDGSVDYAYQVKGMDNADVTAGSPFLFVADNSWREWEDFVSPLFYTLSRGDREGFHWNQGDPTEASNAMEINAATPAGYYLMVGALTGRDAGRDGWYQEQKFYVEVTANPNNILLEVGNIIRGQRVRMNVSNATANRAVYFIYSFAGYGNTPVGQLNVTLALESPVLAGQSNANGSGEATFIAPVPVNISPRPIWLQAAQFNKVSNVHEGQIL